MKTLALILALFTLNACDWLKSSPSNTSQGKVKGKFARYTNDRLNFSIEFPKKWAVETNPKPKKSGVKNFLKMAFNAESPLENKADTYHESIGVAVIDTLLLKAYLAPTDPTDPDANSEEAKKEKEELLKSKTDATKVESNGTFMVGSTLVGWSISKAYTDENGHTLKQMAYSMRKGVNQYKVGWVGEAGKVEMYRPVVERIIKSIVFNTVAPRATDQSRGRD
ncbi:hypothetical protein K1X76_01040 [bacterium]|nr:hypothetical protein [bacterium]